MRPDVQDAVAKLCCSWWTCEADNREFLVSQALPYLLVSEWVPCSWQVVVDWVDVRGREQGVPGVTGAALPAGELVRGEGWVDEWVEGKGLP